eukprot:6462492-Amphidinium_carterae.3
MTRVICRAPAPWSSGSDSDVAGPSNPKPCREKRGCAWSRKEAQKDMALLRSKSKNTLHALTRALCDPDVKAEVWIISYIYIYILHRATVKRRGANESLIR